MDAKQFLTEYKRMCDSFDENGADPCAGCPLNEAGFKYGCDMMALAEKADMAVKLVEDWSRDHPVMTNAMVFEDVFGFRPEKRFQVHVMPDDIYHYDSFWDEAYRGSDNPKKEWLQPAEIVGEKEDGGKIVRPSDPEARQVRMTNMEYFESVFGKVPTHTGTIYDDVVKGLPLSWWNETYAVLGKDGSWECTAAE